MIKKAWYRSASASLVVTFFLGVGVGFGLFYAWQELMFPDEVVCPAPVTMSAPAVSEQSKISNKTSVVPASPPETLQPILVDMETIWPSQHLVIEIPGPVLDEATLALLKQYLPGGVWIGEAGAASYAQLKALTDAIHQVYAAADKNFQPPLLFIAPEINLSQNPLQYAPLLTYADIAELSSLEEIREIGRATARAALALGIGVFLAPPLDVLDSSAANAQSLRSRFFSDNSETVSRAGLTFAEGILEEGGIAVVKHYPGIGAAIPQNDPIPLIPETEVEALAATMLPFLDAAASDVPAILVSNAAVPALDVEAPGRPAFLSPILVREAIRNQWGYTGVIIADDIRGAAEWNGDAVDAHSVHALAAGCEAIMISKATDEEMEKIITAIKKACDDNVLNKEELRLARQKFDLWRQQLARTFARVSPPEPSAEEGTDPSDTHQETPAVPDAAPTPSPEAEPVSQTAEEEASPEAEPETESDAEPGSASVPEGESIPESPPEPKPETETVSEGEEVPESSPEPEPKREAVPEGETTPETPPEPEAVQEGETTPETPPEPAAVPEGEATPEPAPESAMEPEIKPELEASPETEPGAATTTDSASSGNLETETPAVEEDKMEAAQESPKPLMAEPESSVVSLTDEQVSQDKLSQDQESDGTMESPESKGADKDAPDTVAQEAVPAPPPPGTQKVLHRIAPGETLTGIARKYNVSTRDIMAWNAMKNTDIKFGRGLIVYVPESQVQAPAPESEKTLEEESPSPDVVMEGESAGAEATASSATEEIPAAEPEGKSPDEDIREGETPAKTRIQEPLIPDLKEETIETVLSDLDDVNPEMLEEEKTEDRGALPPPLVPASVEPAENAPETDTQPEQASVSAQAETPLSPQNSVRREYESLEEIPLSDIAAIYGVTVAELKEWNNLQSDTVPANQKITVYLPVAVENVEETQNAPVSSASAPGDVPTGTPSIPTEEYEVHTVQSGDTLHNIAARYNTSVSTIIRINEIQNPDLIGLGAALKVPKQ